MSKSVHTHRLEFGVEYDRGVYVGWWCFGRAPDGTVDFAVTSDDWPAGGSYRTALVETFDSWLSDVRAMERNVV